tara:strand:+ start:4748 stop:4939 length:192 start_codon:yes stop_codon:yes gene_type:complete
MPYIKKSEYEFIQDKLRWSKDIIEHHRMFEEYIREHNYELWSFAYFDISRKTGATKPWDKGKI